MLKLELTALVRLTEIHTDIMPNVKAVGVQSTSIKQWLAAKKFKSGIKASTIVFVD